LKLLEELQTNPQSTHLLPTGNTYQGCYQRLMDLVNQDDSLDFSQLTLVNLDEYVENWRPLPPEDTRSFAFYMEPIIQTLARRGFPRTNHFFPHSFCQDFPLQPFQLLTSFDQWIEKVSCASAFLGLGPKDSPHIAFCLPKYTQHFDLPWQEIGAYVGPVDETTRQANLSNYGMEEDSIVPHWACTISPGTLLAVKPQHVYLVAYGERKDLGVLNSPLDVGDNPASILRILEQEGTTVEIITIV
jgi:6-phosphogluconolactonase/glucosamine-6-phosphate isomerase/deaminase